MEILEISRRYFSGESISSIAQQSRLDRKTIRSYIKKLTSIGITSYDREKIESLAQELKTQQTGRPSHAQEIFTSYLDEIRQLVEREFKLKTIYEILLERHEIDVSYSSFKRFVRANKIKISKDRTTCRLEKEPGFEVQVDYAKMGMLYDPILKRRRTVYAFLGTLSASRHKFVQFVYSQNQQSFITSHVGMFNYFGAAPKVITIDNLKSGVIKPDLYDPKLNRAYAEMAEHYDCFINPARVATPKDKPIVERDVQTIREQFKKMQELNSNLSIDEANKTITNWLITQYGQKPHGTTQRRPYEEFIEREKENMLPLPITPFVPALWKEASVHPDHYIQVNKKAYSIPHQYVGKKVWAKVTANMVYIYYDEKLIKQHLIPNGYRQTDFNDFPDNMQYAMRSGVPNYLLNQAKGISSEFGKLIEKILSPHAYINMRKAQGIISIARKMDRHIVNRASQIALENYKRLTPKIFNHIIDTILAEEQTEEVIPTSEETASFLRDTEYFIRPENGIYNN